MITVSRSLVRQLRAVFRRALRMTTRDIGPDLLLAAGPDGLRIQARNMHAAVEHRTSGDFSAEQIRLPFTFLADCEGGKDEPVVLELERGGRVAAGWSDNKIPQVVQYDSTPPDETPFPVVPDPMTEIDRKLWNALAEAMDTTDPTPTRVVTDCVQLCGSGGKVVATDGRQLLVQTGFAFPWEDDLLVPENSLFACRNMRPDAPLHIGCSEAWLTLQTGPWTFHLAIDTERRFPETGGFLKPPEEAIARLELAPEDAKFLADAIQRLPCDEDDQYRSVTVDLNGQAVIRAVSQDSRVPTELVLSRSSVGGENVRLAVDRDYLARAIKLGLRRMYVYGADLPVQAIDTDRIYVWAPLGKHAVVKPSRKAVRIDSADNPDPAGNQAPADRQAPAGNQAPSSAVRTTPSPSRRKTTMAKSTRSQPQPQPQASAADDMNNGNGSVQADGNGQVRGNGQPDAANPADAIEMAEAVRSTLRTATSQVGDLIAALKQQKRATRSVQTALATLRQLEVAGL